MTRAEFITTTREHVRDTDYDRNNSTPRYPDSQIIRVATYSRLRVYEYLLDRIELADYARLAYEDRPGRLTVSKLVKTDVGTTGTAVPSDFHRLICGRDADGKYVPPAAISHGETFSAHGEPLIWVRDGAFRGSAAEAVYYAKPVQAFANDGTSFTEFGDAMMNAVAVYTAMELIHKNRRDPGRFDVLEKVFQEMLSTLQ